VVERFDHPKLVTHAQGQVGCPDVIEVLGEEHALIGRIEGIGALAADQRAAHALAHDRCLLVGVRD